jgi:hypothetical protein
MCLSGAASGARRYGEALRKAKHLNHGHDDPTMRMRAHVATELGPEGARRRRLRTIRLTTSVFCICPLANADAGSRDSDGEAA